MPGARIKRRFGMGTLPGVWRADAENRAANSGESSTARALRVQAAYEKNMVRAKKHVKKEPPPPTPIAIRQMTIDDAAYVLDSWANSYRRSPVTGPIEREVFNIEQRARINRLVSRAASRVFVACCAEDHKLIRGWICFEGPQSDEGVPVLHYVCIHPAYQLRGIGSALVALCRKTAKDAEAPIWSTHETQPMRHIREKWNLLYNPYLLEVPDRKASQ